MKSQLLILSIFIAGIYSSNTLHAQPGWQWGVTNNMDFNGVIEAAPIATDLNGNVFIAGNFFLNDSVSFGTHKIYGQNSAFVAKADSNGHYIWAINTSGAGICNAKALCTDVSGNVYFLGMYIGGDSCRLGTVTMFNPSHNIMDFVAKIDQTGNVLWAKNIVGSVAQGSNLGGLAVDAEGYVYVTGAYTLATATIGPSTLVNTTTTGDSMDVYLAKFDGFGNALWGKSFGGHENDRPWRLPLPNPEIFMLWGDLIP